MRKTITGTGGMLLLQTLKDAGVEYLFTNPGSAETGIFAALAEDGDQRLVVGKHEGLVAAMADGYHRVSGRRVTLAWTLLSGINTRAEDARQLAELTAGLPILLDLFERRASQRTPAAVVQQWARDTFVQPAPIDQRTFLALDAHLLAAAANFDTMYGALWPVVVTPASDDVFTMWPPSFVYDRKYVFHSFSRWNTKSKCFRCSGDHSPLGL